MYQRDGRYYMRRESGSHVAETSPQTFVKKDVTLGLSDGIKVEVVSKPWNGGYLDDASAAPSRVDNKARANGADDAAYAVDAEDVQRVVGAQICLTDVGCVFPQDGAVNARISTLKAMTETAASFAPAICPVPSRSA